MPNEALIAILQEIYETYPFSDITTPINMHNTLMSAKNYAEDRGGNSYSNLFSVAYVLDWIKRHDSAHFTEYRNRILYTLSAEEKDRLKTSLYELDIRHIDNSHLSIEQIQGIKDIDKVGSGNVVVDFLRNHIWSPQNVVLDHNVVKMLCDAIPIYLETIENYHLIDPTDIFPSWHDPFKPKVMIASGYVEGRKKSDMYEIFSCFRNTTFALEGFDRAYNEDKYDEETNHLWQHLIEMIPDYTLSKKDRAEYLRIVREKAEAEHVFMEQSIAFRLTDVDTEQHQVNLRKILELARIIFNTRHGADEHIEYVITLLKSNLNQNHQYTINGKKIDEVKPQELKKLLTLPSPAGDKEFADFLASVEVRQAVASKSKNFKLT